MAIIEEWPILWNILKEDLNFFNYIYDQEWGIFRKFYQQSNCFLADRKMQHTAKNCYNEIYRTAKNNSL